MNVLAELRTRMNRAAGASLAGLVGLGIVGLACWQFLPTRSALPGPIVPPATSAYFIDEATGHVSVAPVDAVPPLLNQQGQPALLRVVFLTPDGGRTRIAAYYEKYTAASKKLLETLSPEERTQRWLEIEAGHLVRRPEPGAPWVPEPSDAGTAVKNAPYAAHPGQTLVPCTP